MIVSEPVQTPQADLVKDDAVVYSGTFGQKVRGVVHEVKELFDETGTKLRTFIVSLPGVGRIHTSGDTLTKVESEPSAQANTPSTQADPVPAQAPVVSPTPAPAAQSQPDTPAGA